MFVGLKVMGKVFCLVKNCEDGGFRDLIVTTATHKRPHEEHMTEVQTFVTSKILHD